jgi:uncharacterized protein YndB with AHSA1/START domain
MSPRTTSRAPRVFPTRRTYAPLISLERTFKAPVSKVWRMWTTKEGLEKWYWPEPLVAKVLHLNVRVGGGYEIAAVNLPHTSRGEYTEVKPNKRLGIIAFVDFIEGVEPYDRIDSVEFYKVPAGTRMVVTSTQMHDAKWNRLAQAGFSSSLDKLKKALES